MKQAVVFIGQAYSVGIIRHFALLGIELARLSAVVPFDFYFASITTDAEKGSWALVRQQLSSGAILSADTFPQLVDKIDALFRSYGRVLVHTGGGWGETKFFARLKRRYGNRCVHVVTTHSFHIESWQRYPMSALQGWLYRLFADHVVFPCPYASRNFLGSRWLFNHGRASIIPLGVEPFPPTGQGIPEDLKANQSLSGVMADDTICKLVYLAKFRSGKMHEWLIQSVANYVRGRRDVVILLCGGTEGALQCRLRRVIGRLGIEKQILMPGLILRQDVPWVLQHCDCAIVPSRAETFGHNFIEPMFAGLPVIGTRVGVGEYAIQDYRTGLGFSLMNPVTVVHAVRFIVEHRDSARQMGAYAKQIATAEFTHHSVAQALARLYCTLLVEDTATNGSYVDASANSRHG